MSESPKLAEPAVLATVAEDEYGMRTAGQRRVNLLWERTQATIAVLVTMTTLGVCTYLVVTNRGSEGAFLLLGNVCMLVVGTYFQRTNHTKTGGVTTDAGR